MKQKNKLTVFALFLAIVTLGCVTEKQSTSKEMEEKFQSLFSVLDTNISFQIKVDKDETTFKNNSDIALVINNKSHYSIFFPLESYIKLWILKNEEWTEVENGITYSGMLKLSPQGTLLLDTRTTRVRPLLGNDVIGWNEKKLVRIFMIGEIMKNDKLTGNMVGAYVDVYVTP